jgi:DNA-binding XRE family transcriptional regulator
MAGHATAPPLAHSETPGDPGMHRNAPADARLVGLIAAIGRAHPSDAVRRGNYSMPAAIDPFVRVYFPVVAAFRLGAQRARRAMTENPGRRWPTDLADIEAASSARDGFDRVFGARVKAAREAAGLTQSRLERDAGLTPTTVTRLERGEYDTPVSELADLAQVLGVDPGTLFPPAGGDPD